MLPCGWAKWACFVLFSLGRHCPVLSSLAQPPFALPLFLLYFPFPSANTSMTPSVLTVCFKPKCGPHFSLADFELAFANLSHCTICVAGSSVDNFMTTLLTGTTIVVSLRSLMPHASCLTQLVSTLRLLVFRPLVYLSHSGPQTPHFVHLCLLCLGLDLHI
jgi:hypothetical protein